jgi:hypothetical protein
MYYYLCISLRSPSFEHHCINPTTSTRIGYYTRLNQMNNTLEEDVSNESFNTFHCLNNILAYKRCVPFLRACSPRATIANTVPPRTITCCTGYLATIQ